MHKVAIRAFSETEIPFPEMVAFAEPMTWKSSLFDDTFLLGTHVVLSAEFHKESRCGLNPIEISQTAF